MTTGPVRVCIVDDQTLVRRGIRSLLELTDDVEVVGEAEDGDTALAMIVKSRPDVVLLDLRMPGRDGISTLDAMRERDLATPTLVLTTFDDADLVMRALQAGARGYLLKDVTLDQLVAGVRTVAMGGTILQPTITDRLLRASDHDAPVPPSDPNAPVPALTDREIDVLRLAAGGYGNRDIAAMLHLAEGTVKNHVSNVLFKLGARDRTHAVLRALHLGLLTPTGERR